MTYHIIWRKWAEEAITTAHFLALEKGNENATAAIEWATSEIERSLGETPATVGESRDGRERVLVETPVIVWYEVNEDEKQVIVFRALVRYRS